MIELALALGADRLEVAHVQYYGWALRNRAALLPSREQLERATALVEGARARLKGVLAIDYVVPDYYAQRPKACMGGWGRRFLNVTPSGKVLPCHAAETLTGTALSECRPRPLSQRSGSATRPSNGFAARHGWPSLAAPASAARSTGAAAAARPLR